MVNEFFSSLSLSAQEQYLLQDEILNGKFGQPGEPFLTTRALSEKRHISVVTAHNVLVGLCDAGYIELKGKKYFLAHGELIKVRNSQTHIIGMLVPRLNNEFYSSLANAVVNKAGKAGYRVIIMSTLYSASEEKLAIQTLKSLNVAGIINCVPTQPETEPIYTDFSLPCVMLGHSVDKSKISSVQVNSFSISQKVAQNLIDEGYKSFFYIGTRNLPLENDVRFTAFQMELRQRGFVLNENNIFRISSDSKTYNSRLSARLNELDVPVGVFCYHDLLAAQVYRICSNIGKKIPEDVGVVGFDDLSIATSLYPSLTTVQYRVSTMADMAISLLDARIKSPDAPYDNYYIEPNLVIRKSSSLSEIKKKSHDVL